MFNKIILTIIILNSLIFSNIYTIENKKSTIVWVGKKLNTNHYGTINIKKGDVFVENNIIESAEIIIDMHSIKVTDIESKEWREKLENHLKNQDFFNITDFPTATFTIHTPQKILMMSKADICFISGDLTILGITKSQTIPMKIYYDKNSIKALGTIEINRTQFGIHYGSNSYFDIVADKAISDKFYLDFKIIAYHD